MGYLTLKRVSGDMEYVCWGCPVLHPTTKASSVAGYPREWKVLMTQILIQDIEHPEKRNFE